jgi:CRISPR/Cas system-associated protein Cas10 (large subunit of type III CRISPR-Cas system)
MNNTEEFYTIVLAGLLHDIGKFWQRAGEKGNHSELGVRFIDEFKDQFPFWLA